MGWILGFCAMASLGLPGLAGFWGEFPAILAVLPARPTGLSVALVPDLHGHRRHRHGVRRRLPALALPAHGLRDAARTSSPTTPTSTTSRRTEWIAWVPMLVLHRRPRLRPGPDLQHHQPRRARLVGHAVARRRLTRRCSACCWPPTSVTQPHDRLPRARARDRPHRRDRAGARWSTSFVGRERKGAIVARSPASACSPRSSRSSRWPATDHTTRSMFGGAYVVDHFALVLKALFLAVGLRRRCCCRRTTSARATTGRASTTSLLLSSVLGMMVMASARDLISIFIALELLSIPAYMLAALAQARPASRNEAGMKYYLMGVFASAVHALRHVAALRRHRLARC